MLFVGDAESPRWIAPLAAFGFVAGLTMIAQTLSSAFLASFGGAILLTIGGTGLLLQAPDFRKCWFHRFLDHRC